MKNKLIDMLISLEEKVVGTLTAEQVGTRRWFWAQHTETELTLELAR